MRCATRRPRGALTVLRARGTELEQTLPYGIVRQLFERAVVRASPEERADALAGAAEHAAPVLEGGLTAPAAAADGDSAFAVLHGLYWLAANLAERRPLVIAIDDLHWADAASISWLAYLAHRIDGLPLLAVSTVRPVRGEAAPALADLLADSGHADHPAEPAHARRRGRDHRRADRRPTPSRACAMPPTTPPPETPCCCASCGRAGGQPTKASTS